MGKFNSVYQTRVDLAGLMHDLLSGKVEVKLAQTVLDSYWIEKLLKLFKSPLLEKFSKSCI